MTLGTLPNLRDRGNLRSDPGEPSAPGGKSRGIRTLLHVPLGDYHVWVPASGPERHRLRWTCVSSIAGRKAGGGMPLVTWKGGVVRGRVAIVGLASLMSCLLCADCTMAPKREIAPLQEEFPSSKWSGYGMTGNVLETAEGRMIEIVKADGQTRGTVLALNAVFIDAEGEHLFSLRAHYAGPDWIHVEAGPSLMLTIDGERVTLADTESSDRVSASAGVIESSDYAAGPELLAKIAAAEEVQVMLQGKDGSVARRFGPENFEIFQEFVRRFITGEESTAGK